MHDRNETDDFLIWQKNRSSSSVDIDRGRASPAPEEENMPKEWTERMWTTKNKFSTLKMLNFSFCVASEAPKHRLRQALWLNFFFLRPAADASISGRWICARRIHAAHSGAVYVIYWKVFSYYNLRGHRQQQQPHNCRCRRQRGHIQFVSALLFFSSFSLTPFLSVYRWWILNCAREFRFNIVRFDRVIDDDGRQRTFCISTFTSSRRDGRREWAITKSNGIYLKRRHGTTHYTNINFSIHFYFCVCIISFDGIPMHSLIGLRWLLVVFRV